jgi:hypothetical protein
MGLRGVVAGALVLVALQTLVQPAAAGRVGGLLAYPGRMARWIISPGEPAIPQLGGLRAGQIDKTDAKGRATTPTRQGVAGYPSPWTQPTTRTGE